MHLVQIDGLFDIDYGAPSPTIVFNDNNLFLAFYVSEPDVSELRIRDTASDRGVCVLKFISCLKYIFGPPSNETIHGHPYYRMGLESNSFYELKDSGLIKSIDQINSVHAYYDPKRMENYKHYVLTFHDKMFECVAKSFEMKASSSTLFDEVNSIVLELFR